MPWATQLALPGVTWVSVAVTHRRRGILRSLMQRQLRSYAEQGCAVAALTASEGGIYQRFGYGPATQKRKTVIDRRVARLREPATSAGVQVMHGSEVADVLPGIYRRWQESTPGAISRSDAWWTRFFLDPQSGRDGATARVYLVHADGYVAYRARGSWGDGQSAPVVDVTDYAVVSGAAHAALWHVLLGLDLFGEIKSSAIPLDDPLPFRLTDPRQSRTAGVTDALWIRLIAAALQARSYGAEIDLVIEVHDELFGDARFRLAAGRDGATCTRTQAMPDLRCDVAALGSLYLGGHRLGQLVAAGRVDADDPKLVARADLALLGDRVPAHGTSF